MSDTKLQLKNGHREQIMREIDDLINGLEYITMKDVKTKLISLKKIVWGWK